MENWNWSEDGDDVENGGCRDSAVVGGERYWVGGSW